MKFRFVLFIFCLAFCAVAVSCRSSAGDADMDTIPQFEAIEGCSLSVPCMIVTPETLDDLPEQVRETAEKHCGQPGTVVVASALRPRYLRLIREQGRLLLGSMESNPSGDTVYLCVLEGVGEAAESFRSIQVEDPSNPVPWNLGIFIKRYPGLAARLNELQADDERLAAAESSARELLRRGSTRVMLEKNAGGGNAALEEARQSEQEQIGVLEAILNRK